MLGKLIGSVYSAITSRTAGATSAVRNGQIRETSQSPRYGFKVP